MRDLSCTKIALISPVQDLLAWLEDSDMQNGGMPAGTPKPLTLPGGPGAAPIHQQAAEVQSAGQITFHQPSLVW